MHLSDALDHSEGALRDHMALPTCPGERTFMQDKGTVTVTNPVNNVWASYTDGHGNIDANYKF